MEVVEHVSDPERFVRHLAGLLAPGGVMILSTPNRTEASRLALITVGEGLGMIPRGTHDWSKFLRPDELSKMIEDAGLVVRDVIGIVPDLRHGFRIGESLALDYLITAGHG
jgi:2-polyprenyl-6-hydroxyphenyl methylase / 3-demethylubiquinone-9 3-methyltransferase